MQVNPPADADKELLKKLSAINVGAGKTFVAALLGLSLIHIYYNGRVEHIFSEEGIQNTLAYVQAAAVVGLLATFNDQFRQGVGITKIITLAEELPATIRNYKSGMTAFAEELHKGKRTPDGYAQVFGRIFSGQPKLSLDNKSWQAFSNTTIQYVSVVRSAQDAPQLMRRMHYMSFGSMFRSDLFEGLCVRHAPRKCAVCGKWFLTTDARHTKYCSGYALYKNTKQA